MPNELSALRADLKDERRTSNVQHRILNKVFCQFINRQSEAISSFDVGRWTFDVRRSKKSLMSYHTEFIKHKMEIPILLN